MGGGVAVTKRVASRQKTPLHAEVNSKERVGLILGAAVLDCTTDEGIDAAARANRASESLNLADGVGVLPVAALTHGAKIVKDTILIEVILKE